LISKNNKKNKSNKVDTFGQSAEESSQSKTNKRKRGTNHDKEAHQKLDLGNWSAEKLYEND